MVATVCPSREMLLQYSLGMLSGEQRDALESHLDCCPDCQAAIMTLDDADDTVIGRLRTPPSSESVLAEPQLQDALAAAMAMPAPMRTAEEGSGLAGRLASDMPAALGEYRLLEELGRGGMGRVYKALHTKLDRVVAVKVLSRGRVGDQKAIVRFEREMKAVGRLAHPNIVQAHDAREIDGTPVLIMEFVDGLDLAEMVRRVGPLPVAEACELVRQTALPLQCAHEHGLVHRDIKPSNLMLARSGEVKLLDLGLARFYAEGDAGVPPVSAGEEMTGTGQAMGTADYMAPEQTTDSRGVDIRADIYSLGATLYKLLSGKAPFGGPDFQGAREKMAAHCREPVPPIRQLRPEVPAALAAVLDRMLAKAPEARYPTPAEVAEAVAPWCADADLPALLRRAFDTHVPPLPPGATIGVVPEGEGRVAGQALPAAKPPLLLTSWGWKWFAGQLILLLLVGGLGFAAGIMIRIEIDRNGNATVKISGTPAPQPTASALAQEGWRLWQAGRMDEATAKFQQAVALSPDNENAWNGLGWASFNSGKFPEAKKAFQRVVELNPAHPAALNGLGQLYLAERKYDAAEPYLLKAAPQAPAAWWGLAKLYLLQGKFDKAEKWAQEIVDSGQSGDDGRRLLQAAKEKHLSEGLRAVIEPPPAAAVPDEKAPPTVTVCRPLVREITDHEEFVGRIDPIRTAEVWPQVAGRLMKVHFQVGATVKQGDLLVELDPEPFVDELEIKTRDVETAQVRRRASAEEVHAAEHVNDKNPGSVPQSRIMELEAKRAEAHAALRVTEGAERRARDNVAFTKVIAPISGRISQIVPLALGKLVAPDSKEPLATIVALDSVYVRFSVDERTVLRLRRKAREEKGKDGQIVPLTVFCGLSSDGPQEFPYQGKVESVDVPMDPATGAAQWSATLPNKDGTLLPGMFARVRLTTSKPHKALLIPQRAVRVDQGIPFVFVVEVQGAPRADAKGAVAKSVVQRRSIKTGQLLDGLRVVESGLTANEDVVVSASDSRALQPGMTVKPQ